MAYARPYGQAQGASPWSAGAPPGLNQQQAQQQVQPMFNQPMGAFDISGAWQGQQHGQPTAQQWVPMQPQFVPNPAFMQQPPPQQQQMQMRQQQMQQRPMHQRSLSAPRQGANGLKRPMNQNNNFGGQQQPRNNNNNNNNNNNRGQQNNNSNGSNQQRVTRQQSRMNNQKGQSNNNNNNNDNNNNNNNRQQKQQQQQQRQQQQQQQQRQQQQQQQSEKSAKTGKVTKAKKQATLKAKQAPANGNKGDDKSNSNARNAGTKKDAASQADSKQQNNQQQAANRPQSKTAERKQLKLQARQNAEALNQAKLPVAKGASNAGNDAANADQKADEPIDQAQLKCVPAVFGFVCKACDVFLRDKVARREHIDSDEHMEKFKAFEEEQKQKQLLQEQQQEQQKQSEQQDQQPEQQQPQPEAQQQQPEQQGEAEVNQEVATETAE